jgi:predicted amidophosphoribosyltransferase
MKCRPGVTTRTFCLKCLVQGEITGFKSPLVYMRCPKCGVEWRTLSAICENCKTPSGSPYYGDCPRCAKREAKAI